MVGSHFLSGLRGVNDFHRDRPKKGKEEARKTAAPRRVGYVAIATYISRIRREGSADVTIILRVLFVSRISRSRDAMRIVVIT